MILGFRGVILGLEPELSNWSIKMNIGLLGVENSDLSSYSDLCRDKQVFDGYANIN